MGGLWGCEDGIKGGTVPRLEFVVLYFLYHYRCCGLFIYLSIYPSVCLSVHLLLAISSRQEKYTTTPSPHYQKNKT